MYNILTKFVLLFIYELEVYFKFIYIIEEFNFLLIDLSYNYIHNLHP